MVVSLDSTAPAGAGMLKRVLMNRHIGSLIGTGHIPYCAVEARGFTNSFPNSICICKTDRFCVEYTIVAGQYVLCQHPRSLGPC